jgi:hypothetical protein
MCYGLADATTGHSLGMTDIYPFKDTVGRVNFIPNRDQLRDEIYRRAAIPATCGGVTRKPKAGNWGTPKLKGWLLANPIVDATDIAYLKKQEKEFYDKLVDALKEKEAEAQQHLTNPSRALPWDTHLPFLRLYHCLAEDEVREAYLNRHETMNRPTLQSRNSADRPPNFKEIVAAKFNDASFEPELYAVPDLHEDFAQPILLSLDKMPGLVTPDQVENRFVDGKTKMLLVINLWSRSGNGAGNLGDDGEELGEGDVGYGSFICKTFVNDDRRNFQNQFNSHILYFWHLVDLLDVLQDTLTVLNQDLSASSESIPTASAGGVTTNKKRKQ